MNIAIIGAGGVGLFYGSKLALQHNVYFVARGENYNTLKHKGLVAKSSDGDYTLLPEQINVVQSLEHVPNVDVILITAKSQDTLEIAHQVDKLKLDSPNLLVISIQNGVDNGEKLELILQNSSVAAAVTYIGVERTEPGTIEHLFGGAMMIDLVRNSSVTAENNFHDLVNTWNNVGIKVKHVNNIAEYQWKKLVWNIAFNIISVLTHGKLGQMIDMSETKEALRTQMTESMKVLQAMGLDAQYDIINKYLTYEPKMSQFKTSMLQDWEKGKPLEYEFFFAPLFEQAAKHDINLPYSKFLYDLIKAKSEFREQERQK